MYELIQVGENTFYMDCPTKVGFYRTGEKDVVVIDSGNDKDAARKVKKILEEQGWSLKAVYNTHSHADHIGGNKYLQGQYGCKVYAPGLERAFTEFPILEPTTLYGGYALKELHIKFLMAAESDVEALTEDVLPEGMRMIPLPGHSYDMVGFRTEDDVVFLADCLSSEETLDKYKIGFLYDVKQYLETLDKVKDMKAKTFVPAHASQTDNIQNLAQKNIDVTIEICEKIVTLLERPMTFEELLAEVFTAYGLTMNISQRFLVGSTVKSYLSYLKEQGKADYEFASNRMLWKRAKQEYAI